LPAITDSKIVGIKQILSPPKKCIW